MPRLRRSDPSKPGITRRNRGRGFTYTNPDGSPVTDEPTLARIEALVLPPAWQDVWICSDPLGHIQAVGTDAKGRRQYRYHDVWRTKQDERKFDRVLEFAEQLPILRDRVAADLALESLVRERVLAAAVRLLDLGFFRIGGEEYAEQNQTYGLATMRRDHVTVEGDIVTFDYIAKSGKHRVQAVCDAGVRDVVVELLDRDDPNPELLAYCSDRGEGWADVRSSDINDYLREASGLEISAKDFRTWSATVLASVALAVSEPVATSPTARKRAITRAIKETSEYLGNTPAVCKSSYIHPRVIDLFSGGITIAEDLDRLGADAAFGQLSTQGAIERAVLELLRSPEAARAARAAARREERAAARAATRAKEDRARPPRPAGEAGRGTRRGAKGTAREIAALAPAS